MNDIHSHFLLNPWQQLICFPFLKFVIQEFYINVVILYVTFGDWLSSPSLILWRFIQIVACVNGLLLFIAEKYFMVTTCITIIQYHNQEIHISTIQRAYLDFTSFINNHLCACVCVCNFLFLNSGYFDKNNLYVHSCVTYISFVWLNIFFFFLTF